MNYFREKSFWLEGVTTLLIRHWTPHNPVKSTSSVTDSKASPMPFI